MLTPPPYGTMRACGFFDAVERLVHAHGGNFCDVLERHGIDPAAIQDADFAIRCTSAAAILDYCSCAFNDRLFGLRLGENLHGDVYGALTAYARVAPDMEAAIKVLLEYMPVIYCPQADVEFVTAGEIAEFRWRPSPDFPADEQVNSLGQSQVLRFLRDLIGRDFVPGGVHLVSEPWRREIDTMERTFGCRVYGRSAANIISFPAHLLQTRIRTSNDMLFGLLGSYFAQVRKSAHCTFVDEIRAFARANLASGMCTIERCATRLETSARTIQRRLTEEGLRYSEIVEQERVEAAKRALVGTADSLINIALNLGYSDQSSFGRAFKRWTGSTPQGFRENGSRPLPVQ
jgi:AraC-like DNA-binding protein